MSMGIGVPRKLGLLGAGHFGFGLNIHEYGENGSDPNGSDGEEWHPWVLRGRGFGLFGHGWPGGFGWGHPGFWDPKVRIEEKFANLMESYDMGVEEIEDFFQSDEYTEIVEDLEHLIDKDDWYLEHAQHKSDRLAELIGHLEEKLLSYQEDPNAEQENDTSDEHDGWKGKWHMMKEEFLTKVIDRLTEKQTTLDDNLDMHALLNEELNTYLDEILVAGGMTEELTEVSGLMSDSNNQASLALSENASITSLGVPEPGTSALALLSLLSIDLRRRRRRR